MFFGIIHKQNTNCSKFTGNLRRILSGVH